MVPSGKLPLANFNPLSPHGERLGSLHQRAACLYFNPLSPHGERLVYGRLEGIQGRFQSTLPTRGETSSRASSNIAWINFNPLSPHGERLTGTFDGLKKLLFQSTLPTRGETLWYNGSISYGNISIHSPHTGRDNLFICPSIFGAQFQSTLPTRGETRSWRVKFPPRR